MKDEERGFRIFGGAQSRGGDPTKIKVGFEGGQITEHLFV